MRSITFLLVLLSCFFLIASCTKSSSDDSSSGGSSNGENTSSDSFRSECGTVVKGVIKNPVSEGDGIPVTINGAGGPNTIIVTRGNGRQLIKLRALSEDVSDFVAGRAMDVIDGFRGTATLFTNECAVTVGGGGEGIVGELITSRGKSVTESLITSRAAVVDPSGSCREELVAGCYQSLLESSQPETGAAVSNFLWKPRAERDGNLVVLLNPGGATVIANGITLTNSGPSNGRGTTARASRPGSSFGTSVQVQAFDSRGRALVFPGGVTTYIIPNGSDRVEF